MGMTAAVTSVPRLGAFVVRMFPPQIYALYGVLWTLSFEGSAAVLAGLPGGWRPSWDTAVRAGSVVLALLFLRMLDEQKDLEYDRVHNPDRPLVTGAVTATELRVAMVVIAVVAVAVNLLVSVASALVFVAALGYGLLLALVERVRPSVSERIMLNLVITYPVQIVLGLYLAVSVSASGIGLGTGVVPLLIVFAGVFLHFEFARKTRRDGDASERLYSAVLRPSGSSTVALLCALSAAVTALAAFRPWQLGGVAWLPYLALLVPAWGGYEFLVRRKASWPMAAAMGFILVFHLSLVAQAALSG
jgi:4-hydroxybenzoate polyprenyltransferase